MQIKDKLWEAFNKNIEDDLGYELVDIEFKTTEMGKILTFFIYSPNGITAEDCEKVSKYLDPKLDQLDLIKGQYYLEVSSPDLDRPLKNKRDFERNRDNELEIKLKTGEMLTGKYRNFLEDSIEFLIDDEIIKINKEEIKCIKVKLVF